MRREVPLVLTAIVGITMIIAHFLPPLNSLKDLFEDWFFIIAAFAIILGILNLILVNGNNIYRKQKGWPFGVVVILGFLVMTIIGLVFSGGKSFHLHKANPSITNLSFALLPVYTLPAIDPLDHNPCPVFSGRWRTHQTW